jgi:hypothetical protein
VLTSGGRRPWQPAMIAKAVASPWRQPVGAKGLSAAAKRRLLDELQELTGSHRKSVLRLLNRPDPVPPSEPGGTAAVFVAPHHRRRYGPDVVEALKPLWEASDRLCGKRLEGPLPLLVESHEGHGHLSLEPEVQEVFLGDLQVLWRKSQPRRRPPKPRTGNRSRPDPSEPDVELIKGWLEAEPLLSSMELMQRLVTHKPERTSDRQMRTLQPHLRGYRLRRIEVEMANNGEPKDGGGLG